MTKRVAGRVASDRCVRPDPTDDRPVDAPSQTDVRVRLRGHGRRRGRSEADVWRQHAACCGAQPGLSLVDRCWSCNNHNSSSNSDDSRQLVNRHTVTIVLWSAARVLFHAGNARIYIIAETAAAATRAVRRSVRHDCYNYDSSYT